MMIKSHEQCIDHNAQCDKEVDKRVENDERQILPKERVSVLVNVTIRLRFR